MLKKHKNPTSSWTNVKAIRRGKIRKWVKYRGWGFFICYETLSLRKFNKFLAYGKRDGWVESRLNDLWIANSIAGLNWIRS